MANYQFRPAARANAKPLIGLYAESGCGKTKSALLLACGFVKGDMSKVGMIETESGRGEAYAGDPAIGGYSVLSLHDDFSPKAYGAAITAAEKAGLQALIIDSASHEWEGANGVLAMAAANQEAGKKGPVVWQRPKIEHQREFMLRLMQTSIPLVVVCMRAKYPMKEVKLPSGSKEWKRSEVLEPKQADDILFEMFVHGWIDKDHKFRGTKYTLDELRECLKDGECITIDSGKRLAAWAAGAASIPVQSADAARPGSPDVGHPPSVQVSPSGQEPAYISADQAIHLEDKALEIGITPQALCKAAKVERISMIEAQDYKRALGWLEKAADRMADRTQA